MTHRNFMRFTATIATTAILAMGFATGAFATTTTQGTATAECPENEGKGVVCGTVEVPENRANPASRLVQLSYAVVESASELPPLVVMAAEAGGSATDRASEIAATLGLKEDRSVVVVEQRAGVGSSAPLQCTATNRSVLDTFTSTDEFSDVEGDSVGLALKDCLTGFMEAGGDINSSGFVQAAQDLVAVRSALEIPSWVLYGEGWSSTVMAETARIDADATAGVILDSYSAASRDVKGEAYAGITAALVELSARTPGKPDLNALLNEAIALFNEDSFSGPSTVNGRNLFYELEGNDLYTVMFYLLQDTEILPAIPYLIQSLADGDRAVLASYLPRVFTEIDSIDWAAHFVNVCADTRPFWSADPAAAEPEAPAEGEEAVDPVDPTLLTTFTITDSVCDIIGVQGMSADYRGAASFAAPTLVLASAADPVAPLAQTEAAIASLPAAQLVSFGRIGHGVLGTSECSTEVVSAWLAEPGADVKQLCDLNSGGAKVISADGIHPTSRFIDVWNAVQKQDVLALIIPIIFSAFAILWLLGWIITLVVRIIQRESKGMLIASGIVPVTAALFVGLMALIIGNTTAGNPALAYIGVPEVAPWLLILPAVGFLCLILVWKLGSRGAAFLATAAVPVWLAMIGWYVWFVVLPNF